MFIFEFIWLQLVKLFEFLFKPTPFKPALVVIDMQHDFVHANGSLRVTDATDIIEPINKLLELPFVIKIGSKDHHPPNHASGDVNKERGLEQVLWPSHCVQGSFGAEFVEGLNHGAFDEVVLKGLNRELESYSAFRDPWHIETTELRGSGCCEECRGDGRGVEGDEEKEDSDCQDC